MTKNEKDGRGSAPDTLGINTLIGLKSQAIAIQMCFLLRYIFGQTLEVKQYFIQSLLQMIP